MTGIVSFDTAAIDEPDIVTNHHRTGVVLAGGYSTRFGEADKALAEIDGTPMVARVVDRLSEVVEGIVVSCRDDQQPAFERAISTLDPDVSVRFALAVSSLDDVLRRTVESDRSRTARGSLQQPWNQPDAVQRLRRRYADGELDDEEYEQRLSVLQASEAAK